MTFERIDIGGAEGIEEFYLRGAKAAWCLGGPEPAFLTEWERGRLTVSEPGLAREPYPQGAGLFRVGPRADLRAERSGDAFVVSGLLRGGADRAPKPGSWRLDPWSGRPGWFVVEES